MLRNVLQTPLEMGTNKGFFIVSRFVWNSINASNLNLIQSVSFLLLSLILSPSTKKNKGKTKGRYFSSFTGMDDSQTGGREYWDRIYWLF